MDGLIKVVVCGEKLIAELCLAYLHQRSDTHICAIVANPKDWQADLITWGAQRRIKVFVGNINDYHDELQQMRPDFIFSLQYRPLVKAPILKVPSRGCVNLHFGHLPRYGGCYPIAWAILNGEKEAGVTLHTMSENFDEGDIIAQMTEPITTETTARDLFDTMTRSAFALFRDNYPLLISGSGSLTTRPQDLSQRLYYGKDSIDFTRDSRIDWQQPGAEIQRRICAFTFQPFQQAGTVLVLPDGRKEMVSVSQTSLVSPRGGWETGEDAGRIVAVADDHKILVASGDGNLLEIGMIDDQGAAEFIASRNASPTDIRFSSEGAYRPK